MAPDEIAELIRLANEFAEESPGPYGELVRGLALVAIENGQQMAVNSRRLAAIEKILYAAAGQVAANDHPGPYETLDLIDSEGLEWTTAVRDGQRPNVIELGKLLGRAIKEEQDSGDSPDG